jgi:prepilin-type N-terminal cleavage/methylation domain-containing protein
MIATLGYASWPKWRCRETLGEQEASNMAQHPRSRHPARRLLASAEVIVYRDRRFHSIDRLALGFTLVEMLVTVLVIVILASIGIPALNLMFTRGKLQGSAREIAVHLGSSRVSAMRLGRNVIVKPSFAEKRLVSFVDDDADFQQDVGEQELSSLELPGTGSEQGIYMMGPDGVAGTDDDAGEAVDGLTAIPPAHPGDPVVHVAVFQPDGSIRDQGGFRISDGKSPANLFEVRIAPPATARVEILKYVYGDIRGINPGSPPGSWFGQGGNLWEWY